jgi:hypothetical protein
MTASSTTTHCILLQGRIAAPSAATAQALADTAYSAAFDQALNHAAGLATRLTVHRFAWSASTGRVYIYSELTTPAPVTTQALAAVEAAARLALPDLHDLACARLELVFDRPGASSGQTRFAHYAVETDPEEGWQDEIFRWYDDEHMPGLAAVEGTICARRYLNRDTGPISLACYDLVDPDVLGCPAWLKVRATAWSDIARPHFTNTLRTMFATIDKS